MYKLGEISADLKGTSAQLESMREMIKEQAKDIQGLKTYQDTQKGQLTILSILWGSLSAIIVGVAQFFIIRE